MFVRILILINKGISTSFSENLISARYYNFEFFCQIKGRSTVHATLTIFFDFREILRFP